MKLDRALARLEAQWSSGSVSSFHTPVPRLYPWTRQGQLSLSSLQSETSYGMGPTGPGPHFVLDSVLIRS
ncbi:hypothetical protein TNCV_2728651 [Trichonephila clavipes]|nr:hypothetical protein TNCV_2728651 [Trichonephila clavipes]